MIKILIVALLIVIGSYLLLTVYGLILKRRGQKPFELADLIKKGGKFVRSSDGRVIEYFTYGQLDNYDHVVINMHGSGLEAKHEKDFYEPICHGLNVKGISISMPGCGYSDIQPGRLVYNWAKDDLKAVLDAEEVDDFMITGHSQGTVHAMAAAKYYKERCSGLGLYAPFVPQSQLDGKVKKVIGDGSVPYTRTVEKLYGAFFFAVIHLSLDVFCKQSGKVAIKKIGKNIDPNSRLAKRFRTSMEDSVIRGSVGATYESTQDVAFEFGYDLFSINNPNIVIWHAKDDTECPYEHSLLLKASFESNSGCKVILKSDEVGYGHLTYSQDKYQIPNQSLVASLINHKNSYN